jgi:hypothetical protein
VLAIQSLAYGAIAIFRPAHIGQPPDELGHDWPELTLDVCERGLRVLNNIVEDGSGDHLGRPASLCHELGHLKAMHHIGLAGIFALLTGMHKHRIGGRTQGQDLFGCHRLNPLLLHPQRRSNG